MTIIRIIRFIPWALKKIVKRLSTDGLWKTLYLMAGLFRRRNISRCYYRYIVEPFYDWRMGIQSRGEIDSERLGLPNPEYYRYEGTSYRDFRRTMKHIKVRPGEDVFIDYGSGKGRVLIMAVEYPFRKVIGLEISSDLNAIAQSNLKRARKKFKCNNIEIITCDATQYILPTDVTVVYMYNPCGGDMLVQVLQRIHESLLAAQRKITLMFMHPVHFEPIAHNFPWIMKRIQVPCYNASKCTIYYCYA